MEIKHNNIIFGRNAIALWEGTRQGRDKIRQKKMIFFHFSS